MPGILKFVSVLLVMGALAGLLIGIGAIRSCARSNAEADIAQEIEDVAPAFTISARDFVAEYKSDEDRAQQVYGDQVVVVNGLLGGLFEESNIVSFDALDVWSVRCHFSDAELPKIREQARSRVLNLKGRVVGVDNKRLAIELRGCTVYDT